MSDISLSKAVRTNLLSLQNTATMMEKTQQRLATGNKVNSALDNPSNFFTASALNSRAADMGNLLDSMASGIKVIEAANNGLTALTKNLESMQSTLRQARQDKSFQTKSFDVTDSTVLKLSGGQLASGVSEISLASATQPGTKAQLTTTSTTPFLGVQSKSDGTSGAGARSVISFTNAAFTAGDKFTVAGVEVTVADTNADTAISADDLVANIQSALDNSDEAGNFKVSLGTGDNAGKVIIETINTSASAAEVVFDLDNDPTTGVNAATKGSVTFNYSAVSSSIVAGGHTISTGGSFESFVTNLQNKAADGNYTVEADATTGKITLTSTKWGVDAPTVNGVANYAAKVDPSPAVTTFSIAATGDAGTPATTTFQLRATGNNLTHTQQITVGGYTDKVQLAANSNAGAVKSAFESIVGADYEVAVDNNFNVTLTSRTNGATAPTISSDQIAVNPTTASIIGAGGADLEAATTNGSLNAYIGTTITISDGIAASRTYTIVNNDNINNVVNALNAPGSVFTVTPTNAGLNISSSTTNNFTVTISGAGTTAFGTGANIRTSDNGVAGQTSGIIGNVNENDGAPPTAASGADHTQTLTIAGANGPILINKNDSASTIQSTLRSDTGLSALYDITVGSDFKVELKAKSPGAGTAPSVSSNQVATDAEEATLTLDTTGNFSTNLNLSTYNGQSIKLTAADGTSLASYQFTNAASGQVSAMLTALRTSGFQVNPNAAGDLEFKRADGQNFTVEVTSGASTAFGLSAASATSTNGAVAQTNGITSVDPTDGSAGTPFVDGQQKKLADQGASVETVAAQRSEFSISYNDKTAAINIAAVKGGIEATANSIEIKNWQDATIAAVNNQLNNQGITGVEAKFDSNGQLSFVAKNAEAKTVAVSGRDAVSLFGNDTVSTGVAEKSALTSIKTVDKFVELINRDYGGQVRASNDNGKLRIENLSTQALDIGIDTGGATSNLKVDGNSVRANLSSQFNELRDQLDKLSDDSSFNGINLLRGDRLKITFNESGTSSIDIQSKDKGGNSRGINAANLGIDSIDPADLDTDAAIDAFLTKLSSALSDLRSQASTFGSNLSSVQNRQDFTKSMIQTLETGAANLTLADMNEEAANLLALQTRQSLSSSALSMASQADQNILQLLR